MADDVFIDGKPLDVPYALPGNNGQPVVPAVQQFLSIFNASTKVFRNPDEAVRNSRENARAMRRDICIMEPLRSRQLASAALPWSLEPENARDPKQQEVCKNLTRIINDIPYFLQYKMSLLEAIFFGRWAVQNSYYWRYKNETKQLFIKDWSPVHGDTLEFFWGDDTVGLLVNPTDFGGGTEQLSTVPTDVTRAHKLTQQEREAFVIHIGEFQAGDFFEPETAGYVKGVGLRTYIYWMWYLKHQALSWAMEYLERYGTGFTIFYFDRGNSASEAAVRNAAQSEAFKNVILWPRDKDDREAPIQRIEPSLSGLQNLMALIDDYFGRLIKLMIVGQEMTSEKGPSGLGGNLATVHENSFQRIVRYDSECLAETLTRELVAILIKYNHPDIDFGIKFKIHLDQKDPLGLMQAAQLYLAMGGTADSDELRSAIGLTKPTDDATILGGKPAEPAAPGAEPESAIEQNEATAPGGDNTFLPELGKKKPKA